MWGRVDLRRLVLHLISIASLWIVVYSQSDVKRPCNTCPAECIGRQCARRWWTIMWGFIVTLMALTIDVWGYTKATDESTIINVTGTCLASALNPLLVVFQMIKNALDGMAMVDNLREALGDDIVTPLFPWNKSHIKIMVGTDVVVNVSPDAHKELKQLNIFESVYISQDLSEALVIGGRVRKSNLYNMELLEHGKLALLRSNVLPPYDELKVLRGNSNIGMTIVAAQAIGYIYGIVVRCVQGLRVSPIEAIACLLNIVSLMKVVLHNFCSLGHRPLLLYLDSEDEEKFISQCKSLIHFEFKKQGKLAFAILITIASMSGLVAYFIINFLKSLNMMFLVPIVAFELTLVLITIFYIFLGDFDDWRFLFLPILIPILNLIGYVWALVVTFKYWEVEQFDVQSSNYLLQVLPYIG